jgi:hypothetical protein
MTPHNIAIFVQQIQVIRAELVTVGPNPHRLNSLLGQTLQSLEGLFAGQVSAVQPNVVPGVPAQPSQPVQTVEFFGSPQPTPWSQSAPPPQAPVNPQVPMFPGPGAAPVQPGLNPQVAGMAPAAPAAPVSPVPAEGTTHVMQTGSGQQTVELIPNPDAVSAPSEAAPKADAPAMPIPPLEGDPSSPA